MLPVNEKPSNAAGCCSFNSYCQTCSKSAKPRQKIAFCLSIFNFIAIFCIIIFLVVYVTLKPSFAASHAEEEIAPGKDPMDNPNVTSPEGLTIYSKNDWNGRIPNYTRELCHPTPFVVISHTASQGCFTYEACAALMRVYQDMHMGSEIGLPDIGYSFVVGGDGNVYEARGWDATNVHFGFVRRCNIGIGFVGNFIHDTPTVGQLNAAQELIKLGVKSGKISEDYKLVAMNETYATLSPGGNLYGIIKKWPHFWVPNRNDSGSCPYNVESSDCQKIERNLK